MWECEEPHSCCKGPHCLLKRSYVGFNKQVCQFSKQQVGKRGLSKHKHEDDQDNTLLKHQAREDPELKIIINGGNSLHIKDWRQRIKDKKLWWNKATKKGGSVMLPPHYLPSTISVYSDLLLFTSITLLILSLIDGCTQPLIVLIILSQKFPPSVAGSILKDWLGWYKTIWSCSLEVLEQIYASLQFRKARKTIC